MSWHYTPRPAIATGLRDRDRTARSRPDCAIATGLRDRDRTAPPNWTARAPL